MQSAAAAPLLALQCGDVFDAKAAKLIGARTIVTAADGRIAQVLPGKATAPGATVVDLSGQTCMPGWIDLHVHLDGESNPKAYEEGFRLDDIDFGYRALAYADRTLKAGFTTVRDLGGDDHAAPARRDQPGLRARPAHLRRRQCHRDDGRAR